jgi:hypothetical protein
MIRAFLIRWLFGNESKPRAGVSAQDMYEAIQADGLSRRRMELLATSVDATGEELNRAKLEGEQVRLMVAEHPGWKAYCDRLKVELQLQKNALCALPPEQFQSAQGLQQKGQVLALEAVLWLHAKMIEEGISAAKRLEAAAQKRAAEQKQAKGIRVH